MERTSPSTHSFAHVVVLIALAFTAALTAQAQSYVPEILHSFSNTGGDGYNPDAALIMDASGNLYGTTVEGGASEYGTVFELVNNSGSYTEQILHSFSNTGGDGHNPEAALIMDASGNLYGTTYGGGASGYGTVFELVNNSGSYTEKILHSFSNTGGDGYAPEPALIMDASGNLYGTTEEGGASGYGTVFELVNNSGTYSETILHSFSSTGGDGAEPIAGVIRDASGNLYGTTFGGGATGAGTVFELVNNSGSYTEKILHSFSGTSGDGYSPEAAPIMDASGNLYGTTEEGGASGDGTVFELVNNSGSYTEQILHSFSNAGGDGPYPSVGLIRDASGNLYGTTEFGGANNGGTVFELVNNSGTYSETILHSFSQTGGDGYFPDAGLISDPSGNLYGTTVAGGANNDGTVFELEHLYSTTTTLTSSPNPANAGDTVQFTLTVTPSQPNVVATGTVTFSVGSTVLGTVPVSGNNSQTIPIIGAVIGIGTYTVTAQFTPSVPYLSGSSASVNQTVTLNGVVDSSGNNTLTGNQTVSGNVTATNFYGNGAGLTGVLASGLSCTGCITSQQLANIYAAGDAMSNALNADELGGNLPSFFATLGTNTFTADQDISGNVTATGALTGASANLTGVLTSGGLLVSPSGTATASQAFNSTPSDIAASAFNSSGGVQNPLFRWQAEPTANNTANPSATLNLLFASNAASPSETGLSVNANGTINFAAGQSFPGSGSGTITGVTAGSGLTGGGTTGNVTLSLPGNNCVAGSAVTAQPFACSPFATLGSNSFSGSQSVTGTVIATNFSGNGSGLTNVAAATAVSATTATTAGSATTATTAAMATTANNALALGGNAPSYYATTGTNTFTGAQTMPSLASSGEIKGGSLAIGGGTAIAEYVSVTYAITKLPAIGSGSCTTFTTAAVSGFTPGTSDTIALGLPSALVSGLGSGVFLSYQAWETTTTANPTITIQACNPSSSRYKGGASGTIRIDVFKH